MGLALLFAVHGERRIGRATVDLYPIGGYEYRIPPQKLAYICRSDQQKPGTHPICVFCLFTLSWRLR